MTRSTPHRVHLIALALAGLTTLPLAAQAQSTRDMFIGNAALSKMSISLVDLDPNDGITPAWTVNSSKGFVNVDPMNPAWADLPPDHQGSLFPERFNFKQDSQGFGLSNMDGIAQSASMTFDQGLATAFFQPSTSSVDVLSDMVVNRVTFSADLNPDNRDPVPATFTITPHTSLVISGESTLDSSLSTVDLGEWAAAKGYTNFTLYDNSSVDSFVFFLPAGVSLAEVDFPVAAANSPESFFLHTLSGSSLGLTAADMEPTSQVDTRTFSVRFDNFGDTNLSGQVGMNTAVYGSFFAVLDKPTEPIPEPSTYVLMTLGLVGMALARRRMG
jgi:PEP-CTERM motif